MNQAIFWFHAVLVGIELLGGLLLIFKAKRIAERGLGGEPMLFLWRPTSEAQAMRGLADGYRVFGLFLTLDSLWNFVIVVGSR